MDSKFTTKSQEVISAANTNAQTAGNPTIETAHILKALMDQREGVAVAVLKAAGLDVDAISEAASAEIKKLPKASGASVQNASLSRAAAFCSAGGTDPCPGLRRYLRFYRNDSAGHCQRNR